MGYYTGDGETSSGGSTVSLRSTGPAVGGAYYTYQRVISTVTAKHGVSLATAQAAQGDRDREPNLHQHHRNAKASPHLQE